jgi:hypothetical protein
MRELFLLILAIDDAKLRAGRSEATSSLFSHTKNILEHMQERETLEQPKPGQDLSEGQGSRGEPVSN